MFFKLVARNSKRDRKDNILYFSSMIISIIAFYIILSLSSQDVMIFLSNIESDAVSRLFKISKVFYVITLVVLFFVVYFLSSMQLERRRHEFGVYLMLGMRRKKLFLMLLMEDVRNNIIALLFGLPVAITISELISLITAKVVGLGIIGHNFSLSFTAILFTIVGFLFVKLVAFLLVSIKVSNKEIGHFLIYSPSLIKRTFPKIVYFISLILGILFLAKAYDYGISGNAWSSTRYMLFTILLGIFGTVLSFFGMRLLISFLIKIESNKKLYIYNFRQIQELVIHRSTILAICSLLFFSSLCLFAAGSAISINSINNQKHIFDYTFNEEKFNSEEKIDINKVKEKFVDHNIDSQFSKIVEIKVGSLKDRNVPFFSSIIDEIKKLKNDENKEILLDIFKRNNNCYLISLTGYNELRKIANLKEIKIKNDESYLYMGENFIFNKTLLSSIVKENSIVKILNDNLKIIGDIQSLPLVTDREISISLGLIVNDDVFVNYTGGKHLNFVSGILDNNIVKEKGLMKAISDMNKKLDDIPIGYESYIQNMGRQLFFVIAASYISIYVSIIFIVVANTIIGVQFLISQRRSYKRYQTLVYLGATYETLCNSSRKQINWYFGFPIAFALINSFFGVNSLFTGFLPASVRINMSQKLVIAILIIILLGIFEIIYMTIIKRNSDKYILSLMEPKREE